MFKNLLDEAILVAENTYGEKVHKDGSTYIERAKKMMNKSTEIQDKIVSILFYMYELEGDENAELIFLALGLDEETRMILRILKKPKYVSYYNHIHYISRKNNECAMRVKVLEIELDMVRYGRINSRLHRATLILTTRMGYWELHW